MQITSPIFSSARQPSLQYAVERRRLLLSASVVCRQDWLFIALFDAGCSFSTATVTFGESRPPAVDCCSQSWESSSISFRAYPSYLSQIIRQLDLAAESSHLGVRVLGEFTRRLLQGSKRPPPSLRQKAQVRIAAERSLMAELT